MKLNDGKTHTISYIGGELYLDSQKLASNGQDVIIEFMVELEKPQDNNVLSISASEQVTAKDVGPGQR